jgi:hypothetical protein
MVLPWRKRRAKKATAKKAPMTPIPVPGLPAKKAPAKKASAKKAPAKKAPVKKEPPAKKAPAKKVPAKKAPAVKEPAKKAPVKKAAPVVSDHALMAPITTLPEWAQTLMGTGTEIIEFPEIVKCPMVVQISHDGPERFEFQFRDAWAGDKAFEISGKGTFQGRYSLNFSMDESFKYLKVDTKGSWILHFEPVSQMRVLPLKVGATIEGVGSDVIQFHSEGPMRLDISAPHTKNAVRLYGNTRRYRRRLLWEFGAVEATVLTEHRTAVLEVVMDRPSENDTRWQLTVGEISRPQP